MKDLPKAKGIAQATRDKSVKAKEVKNKSLTPKQRERKEIVEEVCGVDLPWRHPFNDSLFDIEGDDHGN